MIHCRLLSMFLLRRVKRYILSNFFAVRNLIRCNAAPTSDEGSVLDKAIDFRPSYGTPRICCGALKRPVVLLLVECVPGESQTKILFVLRRLPNVFARIAKLACQAFNSLAWVYQLILGAYPGQTADVCWSLNIFSVPTVMCLASQSMTEY